MARKTTETLTLFAQKKLLGKAHTSNLKQNSNEGIGSAVQLSSAQIFGEPIPNNPTYKNPTNDLYNQQGGTGASSRTVEFVEFDVVAIPFTNYNAGTAPGGGGGSDAGESSQSVGAHGYALQLTSGSSDGYEANTDNDRGKAGQGVFNDGMQLYKTFGKLQIVPESFSQETDNPYELQLYKNDGQPLSENNKIGVSSNIDWQVDTYNGIIFVQDYDPNNVPYKARGFIYVGDMVSDIMAANAGDITSVTAGTGLSGGGTTGAVTLNVDRPFSRNKTVQSVTAAQAAESVFTISGSNMSIANHDPNYIDLFLNGQLLHSGTNAQMSAGQVDYTVTGNSTVKFSFDVEIDDNITLIVFQG